MRGFKFRAWNVDDKYMVDSKAGIASILKKHILDGNYKTGWYTESTREDSYIIMQFTGLKDRLGKEIYEGDVMSFTAYDIDYIGIVTFLDGNFCIVCDKAFPYLDDAIKRKGAIWVGNIFESQIKRIVKEGVFKLKEDDFF